MQIADAIDEEFSLFSMQMATSHCCTAFDYEVSCIIGKYLNACVKASETVLLLKPGGKFPEYFQYLQDKLAYGRYVGHPPPPSLRTIILNRDNDRSAAVRRVQEPAPRPNNIRDNGGFNLGAWRGGGRVITLRQCCIPADGNPDSRPRPIQRLRLLPVQNTRGICRKIYLSILGGAALCKLWHMGFRCFKEPPGKGSPIHSLELVIDKVAATMFTSQAPAPAAGVNGIKGSVPDREAEPHRLHLPSYQRW